MDVFTREYGRFRLLAKGARRQKTGQSAVLQSFQPLIISWTGKRGLPVLTGVEARELYPRLRRQQLASAYYLTELLFKFLHANDAHEALFEDYEFAIRQLGGASSDIESVLRVFECSVLSESGYGLQLSKDAMSHQPITPDARYFYHPDKGPVQMQPGEQESGLSISGETLQALANKQFNSAQSQRESKQLLRTLLSRRANGRAFRTRQVYAQMLKQKKASNTQIPAPR